MFAGQDGQADKTKVINLRLPALHPDNFPLLAWFRGSQASAFVRSRNKRKINRVRYRLSDASWRRLPWAFRAFLKSIGNRSSSC
jgi:hypothetical protein